VNKCPIKNDSWIKLVNEVGEVNAYKYFILNNEETPSEEQVNKIIENRKPTPSKLLKLYNADINGFIPKNVIVEKLRIDAKKLGLEVREASNGKYYLTKEGKKINFYSLSGEGDRNSELENKLKGILSNIGIKVESYSSLVNKLGVDASGAADILNKIIYISEDKAKLDTLPEEVAHFFIAGLGTDNPLVSRLMNSIKDHPIYKEVEKEYSSLNLSEDILKEEAVGKLLGKYIVQEFNNSEGVTIWNKFKGTLDLIIDKVLKLFKKITNKDLYSQVEEIYGDFAKDILKGNINPSKEDKVFYQLSKELKEYSKIVEDKLKAIKSRVIKYSVYQNEYKSSEKIQEYLDTTIQRAKEIEELNKLNHEEAYSKLLLLVNDGLKDIKERISSAPLSQMGLSRSIEFVTSYKDINLVESDSEVIKKIAGSIEGERVRIEAELLKLSQESLSEIVQEESLSDKEDLITPIKDLSFDQRWLGAMANADDTLLAVVDKLYKREVVDKTSDIIRTFKYNHDKLYEKVNKEDLSLLFEKVDSRPNFYMLQTNDPIRFTSKYKYEYYLLMDKAKMEADAYPKGSEGRKDVWKKFFSENHTRGYRDEYGNWINGEPLAKFENEDYKKIQSNKDLKEYYDFIMRWKENSDNLMGLSSYPLRKSSIPYFFSDLSEKIAKNKLWNSLKGLGKEISSSIEYTKGDRALVDESDKEVKVIRKQGVARIDESQRTYNIPDIISAYVYSANLYRAKREVQGIIELAKTYAEARKIPKTNWRGKVLDQNGDLVNIEGASSASYQRFKDWYNMIYIGDTDKEKGFKIFGKEVSDKKIAKAFGKYSSITALGLNLFSAVSNIVYGGSMQVIEAMGGEFYSAKDYLWATKKYGESALSDKMKLMLDYYRVLQDTSYFGDKKSMISKILFGANSAGEHMMQSRIFLAMSHNYKVKDAKGVEYNLWDAYEVVEGRLKLKEGIELSQREISDFRRKVEGVNQRLHGRYTDLDNAALSQTALGYLALQYRKWIHPGYEARFRNQYFDERLGQYIKGRYLSYLDFFKSIKELKSIAAGWNNLSDHDKANMKRNIAELVYLTGTILLLSVLRSLSEDDDELDDSKAFNFFMYQVDRFNSELKFYNIGIVTGDLTKLIRTPAASISVIENVGRLLNDTLQYPFRDEEENIVKGEEYTKIQRDFERLIPLIKETRRWSNLEDQATYFKTY